ncbi:Os05g0186900 [Oryza sativa Japonica Group]|uniref:Os05g0186900 protein n=1 Tax=Oryza sativa subsp. japonica TaxID=39947 RepID=A0A0P0WIR1_ORYSJ|nr:hypothetical protein EE612_027578 [Oryza sativa]BAS92607.1 Os05g0186900 [Oryza sativa Japonica Group]
MAWNGRFGEDGEEERSLELSLALPGYFSSSGHHLPCSLLDSSCPQSFLLCLIISVCFVLCFTFLVDFHFSGLQGNTSTAADGAKGNDGFKAR